MYDRFEVRWVYEEVAHLLAEKALDIELRMSISAEVISG
jgi:hypothetical protein